MTAFICVPRCFTCGENLNEAAEGWCSELCERTIPVHRWACHCGRFIAEASIETVDHRDDSSYYGIRTDWSYTCSRCGTVTDDEPILVAVGSMIVPLEAVRKP